MHFDRHTHIINQYSPFFVGILKIGGGKSEFKFSDVFGVVDASRKHLRQVGGEGGQAFGQMSIKTLKEKKVINIIK